mmetsp:Transcript_8540/g.22324  ORF Transcript_8540/g.22324 Transcript_8540/m.22324 type:complete len:280 (+) Transcript_8540:1234-2073(+)
MRHEVTRLHEMRHEVTRLEEDVMSLVELSERDLGGPATHATADRPGGAHDMSYDEVAVSVEASVPADGQRPLSVTRLSRSSRQLGRVARSMTPKPVRRAVGRLAGRKAKSSEKSLSDSELEGHTGHEWNTATSLRADAFARAQGRNSTAKMKAAFVGAVGVSRMSRTHELGRRIASVLAQMRSDGEGLSLADWCQGSLSQPLILHAFSAISETAHGQAQSDASTSDLASTSIPSLQAWVAQNMSRDTSSESQPSDDDDDDDDDENLTTVQLELPAAKSS